MAVAGGRLNPAGAPRTAPAQEILSTLATPVLVIDAAGRIVDANVAAETLLNLGRQALVARTIESVTGHPLTSVPVDQPFAAYDIVAALPGGRRERIDLMVAPLPDRAGWRSVTLHPRTPQRLAGRQDERAGGTRTAVAAAAMLAHEIKNPLSGIRGAAQLIGADAGEEVRALTTLIRDEVDRVTALIDRMEGFTDTRTLPVGPQNIHAVLGHVRDVALRGFAAGCTVRELYDPSLPDVLGHRDALIQIVMNLVKNAAEALERADNPGGTITLTTAYRHGPSRSLAGQAARRIALPIEVCVIDDGPGAPEGQDAHIFDPFVTSKQSGGGLGLALVDKLVRDLNGAIEYAREGTPPRTVFRILLPRT